MVGGITSERWAELSRNGWATSFRNHGRLAPESAILDKRLASLWSMTNESRPVTTAKLRRGIASMSDDPASYSLRRAVSRGTKSHEGPDGCSTVIVVDNTVLAPRKGKFTPSLSPQ